ncbi:MAG: potassium transporter Kup [Nitrospirae bacterium GWC2_46_6]|nr:MAG: potassium transporter Kup [Nitrospirae bacterium GWA2_46_11]OGW23462.1 MAG: potassium transporter Kup [Nitrospirae bacterium GWC2_46_6]OGW23512.1 MAG: potassium transporter Kup [Nitrospirae bacterium GWB2_47_37]HAK87483.1 potassium transporter Kup [Nitrospiraceae bacterium]HCZ10698.1 potassium transporter Kup [Nitrospiraceae bacterium]
MLEKESPIKGIIKSLGLVFGDIGTSPIYTLTVIFLTTRPTENNVIGVLSLIVWTLTILVTVEYTWLAMSLSRKGEGGTIVLKEILLPLLKSGRKAAFFTLLSFVGISLLVGDGVITPAISILSAVEGMRLIPGLEKTGQETVVIIAAVIAIVLFSFQRKGTERVAVAFGPLMIVWFLALAVSGIASILQAPQVLKAVNPYYAFNFFAENGIAGFFVLSEVILCATGGEALYADMGHLGRMPILRAWYFVCVALLLNYFGQGAFLIQYPGTKNVLFEMMFNQASLLYIPFLILSIAATIIASQAMISGMFSIFYQAIMTHIMPLFKVDYTSTEIRSQIYIGFVNWFLLISVLFIMFEFRESHRLAAAYGMAVNVDMMITGILMTSIFYFKNNRAKCAAALLVVFVDVAFLISNTYKIPHGGYWSIIIALIPFCIIMIYTRGQRRLYKSMKPMPLRDFLTRYEVLYRTTTKIGGTALYFARDAERIPPYIVRTMFTNNILYEDNIIVSIIRRDDPFGVTGFFKGELSDGLRHFEIQLGYMEVIDVEEILREAGIREKSIFYGLEDIATRNIVWKTFSIFKRLTPAYVQFYKLPSHKLHGVITRVEM